MEQKIPLAMLAQLLGGKLTDPSKGEEIIGNVRSLDAAGPGDLAFLWNDAYADQAKTCKASAIICKDAIEGAAAPQILVADPQAAMLMLLGEVYNMRHPAPPAGVHPSAVVAEGVKLGEDVSVGAGAVIEEGSSLGDGVQIRARAYVGRHVTIGEGSIVHPNATVLDHVQIGKKVVIWSGAVIGKDGFGFVQTPENVHKRIPQIGSVILEDYVEVGPGTTIDRGALDNTIVRKGVKIDCQCHIAHGCDIGENAMLVGTTRMGGSVTIGKNAYLLQNAGVSTGRTIGEGAILGSCARVLYKDVPPGETVGGSPARPATLHRRIEATLTHLPDMRLRLKRLEKAVAKLTE